MSKQIKIIAVLEEEIPDATNQILVHYDWSNVAHGGLSVSRSLPSWSG
jgi:hypothetical protein